MNLDSLSAAERKIVAVVGEYVGLLREQGKNPTRTLEQLRNRNLIGAAETAVAKGRPTQGFETLVEAKLEDLSYEQIIVDHLESLGASALVFETHAEPAQRLARGPGGPNREDPPAHRALANTAWEKVRVMCCTAHSRTSNSRDCNRSCWPRSAEAGGSSIESLSTGQCKTFCKSALRVPQIVPR